MSQTIAKFVGASILTVGAATVPGLSAASTSVVFGDPKPNVPETDCNGISYEWTVTLGKPARAGFVHHVGAKSWNEPPPFYEPPETGWTHTSNFVALELKKAAKVRIEISRQQGVLMPTIVTDPTSGSPAISYNLAGSKLFPAFSIWKGWEEEACEYTAHRYDNAGPIAWAPSLDYVANQPNAAGWTTATLIRWLPAGKYTLAIGGANVSFCSPTDAACYGGRQGYRASISTE